MKTNFSNKLRLFVGETLRALQVDHQLKEGWLRIVSAAGVNPIPVSITRARARSSFFGQNRV